MIKPAPESDAMWVPPTRPVTVAEVHQLAKKLRLKAYYDNGDHDEDERSSSVREARSSALITFAETIDEVFQFDSQLTQADLDSWRR